MAHRRRVSAWVVGITLVFACSAFAQTAVRVIRDGAIIWGREAHVPLVTVKSGTVLEVVSRERGWYVVRVPPESGGHGEVGLIADTQVETVAGTFPTEPQTPANPAPASASSRAPRGAGSRAELLGFGQLGYNRFLAHDTFNAIFGDAGAPAFGGGVQLNLQRRLFIEGSIDWMAKNGQRVFVNDGQAFPLGISEHVRLLPVSVSAGYRHPGRSVTPYVGAGVGVVFYQETSQFADPSENVNEHFTSYQAVVGFEVSQAGTALRTAIEVQFSTVPKGLGSSGASAAFNEHNLGGIQARIKILAGRKSG